MISIITPPTETISAYIDPGTSSAALQVGLIGLAGGLITIKVFWARIRRTLSPSLLRQRHLIKLTSRLLALIGIEISVSKRKEQAKPTVLERFINGHQMRGITIPDEYLIQYQQHLIELKLQSTFDIYSKPAYDVGDHPTDAREFQANFATEQIARLRPSNILDIGSPREWILGILCSIPVTTVDVRERKHTATHENEITCDAKNLTLPDNTFDMVTSLCSLEHFGLGRYGDEFDPDGDRKAIEEISRVLKSRGHLVFTTTITNAHPYIAFNAYRVYNYEMIRKLCSGLVCDCEAFYSIEANRTCTLDEVTNVKAGDDTRMAWDIYCGCYRKED